MKVAFYAPMKAPDHPTPSGDRAVARLLLRALSRGGFEVRVASRFRSYEGAGCERRQGQLERRGKALAERLLHRFRERPREQPQIWFTYHLYHKAPDWIGPRVTRALGIPYIVAEASHAPRRAEGEWQLGYRAALAAIRSADAIVCMNPVDRPGIEAAGVTPERVLDLAPFVDARRLQSQARSAAARALRAQLLPKASIPTLITVAMMRTGDKLHSYRVLAAALARLLDRPWRLLVVGDGSAAAEVRSLLAELPGDRVLYAGQHPPHLVPALVAGAYAMVWPACNEAWGMVFLEAAALEVPAVAGDDGGVASVVEHGVSGQLAAAGDPRALAGAVAALLDDPGARDRMACAARARVLAHHDLPVASAALAALIERCSQRC